MSHHVLTIYPEDLGPRVLPPAGRRPTGEEIAAAVRHFLQEHQPRIAELVRVEAGEGHAAVIVLPPHQGGTARRGASNALDLLRAVEGSLGMADKLPEVLDPENLPELAVDAREFPVTLTEDKDEPWEGPERLRSKVRYFPLPTCQWFEICDGELILAPDRIIFEPHSVIVREDDEDFSGRQVISLTSVVEVRRDTWWHVPCLRIETRQKAYRYGWPARRGEPGRDFELDEWLSLLDSMRVRHDE